MAKIKISVCITIYNESQDTISNLLNALSDQTLKPDEIVIVDGSNSKSNILNSKKYPNIKIINFKNVSRAKGRNIAIKKAKNEIIAITDAGCIPHKDWLEKITAPFKNTGVDVVAGSYQMIANNNFENSEAVFLGVAQKDINSDFMPSARSMAFTKTIWRKAGGFPETLTDTAEDTVFNINLLNVGANFKVAKKAIVDWYMPDSIREFSLKIHNYAKGDALSGIWWHPTKKWKTHNLKILTIFGRYLLAFILLAFGFNKLLLLYLLCYMLYAYSKAKLWGVLLQFVSDFACIIGFSHGIFSRYYYRN